MSQTEQSFKIIEKYIGNQDRDKLVQHQIESYNHFTNYQMERTIQMFNPVRIVSAKDYNPETNTYALEVFVNFSNLQLIRPVINESDGSSKQMLPQDARTRNFTYSASMLVDIEFKYVVQNNGNTESLVSNFKAIPIGKLPIMIKSNLCLLTQFKHLQPSEYGECKYDIGGYFIINGSEKTVLAQERASENKIYCYNVSKNNTTKYSWSAEIKSIPDKCISPKQTLLYLSNKDNGHGFPILIQIPKLKIPIDLFIIFRALGVITDKDICSAIVLNINNPKTNTLLNLLEASIHSSSNIITQKEALLYLAGLFQTQTAAAAEKEIVGESNKETREREKEISAMETLKNELFPHCTTLIQKIAFLGYMTNKILVANITKTQDDRDSYLNKRIDTTGVLLNNLFRNYFNEMIKFMEKKLIQEINNGQWKTTNDYRNIASKTNIYKIIKASTIESGFRTALSTGDFRIKHTTSNKIGVAQLLNRLTYISALSHTRRVATPSDKNGKLIAPRKLHGTSWGFLCPSETPEGAPIGIVKNLSILTIVSIGSSISTIREILSQYIEEINDNIFNGYYYSKVKVFCNGVWLGIPRPDVNPIELFNLLKEYKITGKINPTTSIIFDYNLLELRICNDAGRLLRPLIRVGKIGTLECGIKKLETLNMENLTWNNLFIGDNSILEYIDADEQQCSLIATRPNEVSTKHYTHCEIHPCTIYGVLASCIPFPNYNQSPRITYQCLDINETVLMSNGSKVPIKDIRIGDCVVSFHPETMETSYTKVVYQYVRETDKKLFKITTVSGREVIATEDHKFMTTDGWCEVGSMIIGKTNIGILPYQHNLVEDCIEQHIILTEEHFRDFSNKLNLSTNIINYFVLELKNNDLLPLTNLNYKLPILSRIFGFILANSKELNFTGFNFETETDANTFDNDIKLLCGKYDILQTLLLALGHQPNEIPSWIMNGTKLVKREFLSSFQGNTDYNFDCIKTLLNEFGIENNTFNLKQYFDNIGYRYASTTNINSAIKIEYLKYLEFEHKHIYNLETFSKNTQNNMLFVPIKNIKEIKNRLVSDITVESENHSFIAGNNFLSSNCAQGKQAMGIYATNYNLRMDKTSYILNSPMRPLVDTRIMDIMKLNEIPAGKNIIVAIMTHTGYNQEDSILINKGSVDRGLFEITAYHTEKDEDKQKVGGEEEIRCNPDFTKTRGKKSLANYSKLNSLGVIPENTRIDNRDVIIGKVIPIKENRNDFTTSIKYEDCSKVFKSNEETYIDKNIIDKNSDGYTFAKVRLRTQRKPVVGDKFSSRFGQKGTCGSLIPECNMPTTLGGIRPDIIINPHAIPSRMTIGQLKEMLLCKVLVELGLFGDGTAFDDLPIDLIYETLSELGKESYGNELLIDGMTGEMIECNVFIGPVFYQRLKHMVNDKTHSRSTGPMMMLTRQPAEGRSRDGGLKFGQMERDCIISHGTSRFLKERMYDVSDKFTVYTCKSCGAMAIYNPNVKKYICGCCKNNSSFAKVELPYACKLAFQELNAMGINTRIMT